MRNIFHVCLDDYRVITPEMLYGDYRPLVKNEFMTNTSSLYVISRIPKLRFVPSKCRIGFGFNVRGRMRVGADRVVDFDFSVPKFWHELSLLHDAFESPAQLAAYCMEHAPMQPLVRRLSGNLMYKLLSRVKRESSSESRIAVDCLISLCVSGGETARLDMYPHRVANICDLDMGDYPEVLYVGISNKNTFDRLEKHSTLQRILAERGDDYDIILHFISMEDANIRLKVVEGLLMLANDYNNRLSKNDINEIAETVLIHYFQPRYNDKKKRAPVAANGKVKRCLVAGKYTEVLLEFNTSGVLSRFGSSAVMNSNHHVIRHPLAGPPEGDGLGADDVRFFLTGEC